MKVFFTYFYVTYDASLNLCAYIFYFLCLVFSFAKKQK
jgi:hypothetical protein